MSEEKKRKLATGKEEILAAVAALQGEAVSMLEDIVRIDSTLGAPGEVEVQEYMFNAFSKLKSSSLKVEKWYPDVDRLKKHTAYSPVDWDLSRKFSVACTHTSASTSGKSLIFNGHVDVVPVTGGEDRWSTPPFQPAVRDGRLYGRGAGDMKAGVVAMYIALKALLSLGVAPAASFALHTVLDEECTGNYALDCVLRSPFKSDAVIIPEPFPAVLTAQLGVMWMRVAVRGKPVHVLQAGSGNNAIEAAVALFNSLKPLEEEWNSPAKRHPEFKDCAHPINFNLGKITGGNWASSVPSDAIFQARVGFFPGEDMAQVRSLVETTVKAKAADLHVDITFEWVGFQAEGCVYDRTTPMAQTLARVHQDVLCKEAKFAPVTCTTDGRHYLLHGGMPTAVFGPEAQSIHGIDESVSLDSMKDVAGVMAVFISEWCGLEPCQ